MFKVALVQNISEMRNYAYADIRRTVRDMGFEVVSLMRDNIEELIPMLNGELDCVLFASNSLNDDIIYNYVCQEGFINRFNVYLENGGAVIILHQIKLCGKDV